MKTKNVFKPLNRPSFAMAELSLATSSDQNNQIQIEDSNSCIFILVNNKFTTVVMIWIAFVVVGLAGMLKGNMSTFLVCANIVTSLFNAPWEVTLKSELQEFSLKPFVAAARTNNTMCNIGMAALAAFVLIAYNQMHNSYCISLLPGKLELLLWLCTSKRLVKHNLLNLQVFVAPVHAGHQ